MVIEYKCPNCGSNMVFDSQLQKMVCQHCATEKTVDELKNIHKTVENRTAYDQKDTEDFGDKDADFVHYKCSSCGAEILTDEHTVATFCSFCQSPNLIASRVSGEKTPAQLIPFKINKDQAKELYRSWCKKGVLTPKDLTTNSMIEKISGFYVPFWLYDYHAEAYLKANCTKVRYETRGDYNYVHTDHFYVEREAFSEYQKVPSDASIKMDDTVMDLLEPFHYEELKKFEMPYLSGYLAEKYNYDSNQLSKRIETRVSDFILQKTHSTIQGYASVVPISQNVQMNRQAAKYTMLPVWILNYRYKEKEYQFAINGQTGKIVANRPVSTGKAVLWFIGTFIVSFVVSLLVGGVIS